MLADRQQFEMGEVHVEGVGDEPIGECVIGEEPARPVAPPGAQMHLIDRHRLAPRIDAGMDLAIGGVVPGEIVGSRHEGGGGGPQFAAEAEGIGLQRQDPALVVGDLVFVDRALAHVRGEDLPSPLSRRLRISWRRPSQRLKSPTGDAGGVRRPDGEMHARHALIGHGMGAQPLIELGDACPRPADGRPSGRAPGRRRRGRGAPRRRRHCRPAGDSPRTGRGRGSTPRRTRRHRALGQRPQHGTVLGQHLDPFGAGHRSTGLRARPRPHGSEDREGVPVARPPTMARISASDACRACRRSLPPRRHQPDRPSRARGRSPLWLGREPDRGHPTTEAGRVLSKKETKTPVSSRSTSPSVGMTKGENAFDADRITPYRR